MDWLKILENTVSSLVGIDAAYFALAALGLNIQFGYTGLLNFGQAAFMACGAYGIGMTAQYFDVSMWYGIPIALAFVVILSLLVGIPTLRYRNGGNSEVVREIGALQAFLRRQRRHQ